MKGNVTAGHHHAAETAGHGVGAEGRRGDLAQVHRPHACIDDGLLDGLRQLAAPALFGDITCGARAQVVRVTEGIAGHDAALLARQVLQVFEFGAGVDVDLELGKVQHIAPSPAGAELEYARGVVECLCQGEGRWGVGQGHGRRHDL
jgi:hypothetical protein